MKTPQKRINNTSLIIISALTIALWYLPTGFENPDLIRHTKWAKANVIHVDNQDLEHHSIVVVGTQELSLRVLSGAFNGDTVQAHNVLMGQKKIDKIFRRGDQVLAVLKLDETDRHIISARADDIYRISMEWILLLLFALFLVGFAGKTGFKALLSFVFTAMVFWKLLIPSLLKGYSPLLTSFLVVVIVTAVIILLINGFSRKGWVALSGSIAGIAITTCLAILFGHYFAIPGTVQEFSESLLYTGFGHLNLSAIFIACIFISAAGAVMDVAMDISAAQHEVVEKKPDIATRELIKSGFNVAYPVIGTMTTTLLFAYSGSFMFVFMMFMTKGTAMISIFNTNYIAAEILHTLVGSFGLVLVAPITAIVGGLIYPVRKS